MVLDSSMRQNGVEIAFAQLAKKPMPFEKFSAFVEDCGAHPSALVGRQIRR